MKTIEVKTDHIVSKILIGERLQNLEKYLPNTKVVIITDENVHKLYYNNFPKGIPVIIIGLGEQHKTLKTLEHIFSRFIDLEIDRSSFVVAIGGGIVCDVAGFAASVFMRGLNFGFVSTTLLSQVDASVGGKNGVNFERFKNMVGVFKQPQFVICDETMLSTLSEREFKTGLAEIVKAAVIRNLNLFEFIENHVTEINKAHPETINTLVYESVLIKAKVVEADEREKGERRILNFGHTIGHAIEKLSDVLHGEAVSIGMTYASKISASLGLINNNDSTRIIKLLEALKLPVKMDFKGKPIFNAIKQDKKREGSSIHFVLLNRLGNAFVEPIPYSKLEKLIDDLY
ncbi:MAG: 3-dehydroquinate synthase [Bacteroidales bacterium]|nr:3-dehydroquinate synthase [Bacteroidales bacterium]